MEKEQVEEVVVAEQQEPQEQQAIYYCPRCKKPVGKIVGDGLIVYRVLLRGYVRFTCLQPDPSAHRGYCGWKIRFKAPVK